MVSVKNFIVCSLIISSVFALSSCKSKQPVQTVNNVYPEKTIQVLSYFNNDAGPGVVYSKIAQEMAKLKGWNIEYVKQENLADVMNNTWKAPHDGYTVAAYTESGLGLPISGKTTQTAKDWTYFIISQDQTALAVADNSSYKSVADLVKTAKDNPGKVRIGISKSGSVYHLKAKVFEKVAGVSFQYEFLNSEDAITNAAVENKIDALFIGAPRVKMNPKLRPIMVTDLSQTDFGGSIGKVINMSDLYPDAKNYLPMDSTLAFVMPSDVPKDIVETFGQAFTQAIDTDTIATLFANRSSTRINLWGDSVKEYMITMESKFSWFSKELGLTKVDPETLGIKK